MAWLLACATFLLINVGGTVTTYDAGMAIRDWPTTDGHWFYPLPEWLAADRDVFLEHGHRLLAQCVGLVAIALAVALWRLDGRKWMRWLGAAVVAGVIFQGVVGGFRVLGDGLLLGKVHACTAPLLFAFCTALVTLTSRRWRRDDGPEEHPAARRLHRWAWTLTGALYLEIVLGVQLRHLPRDSGPGWFVVWVWLKLITAGLIAGGVVWLLICVLRRPAGGTVPCPAEGARTRAMIVRRARLLAALLFLQLVLGAATWVTNLGWPAWFRDHVWATSYTVVAEGPLQVIGTTAYAAAGSLNLAAGLSLALWSRRLWRGTSR